MVGRRKPLVLASTKSLMNSLIPNSNFSIVIQSFADEFVELRAGILRFPKGGFGISSFDDPSLVYLSVSDLKRLGLTSGSLVVALDPPDEPVLRVNSTKTTLVLGGSSAAAVPPDLLISEPMKTVHLQSTIKALGSVLAPVLCPSLLSSRCSVAFLLHGLSGSGKETVVRYVSQRLGLHVVEYSCHTFMAASEKKTLSLLAEAFAAAHSYSPAILLLRHFDVFRNWPSPEGAESDNSGITSEVASIIRKYTQPLGIDGEIFAAENLHGGPGELENLVKDIAPRTSGFTPRDLRSLVADAASDLIIKHNPLIGPGETAENEAASANPLQSAPAKNIGESPGIEALLKALEQSKKRIGSALGAPKVPDVNWEDVGGLEDVMQAILDTVQLPPAQRIVFFWVASTFWGAFLWYSGDWKDSFGKRCGDRVLS